MRRLNQILENHDLKAIKTLGEQILIVPVGVGYGLFEKAVFKGSLDKCEKYVAQLTQSEVA